MNRPDDVVKGLFTDAPVPDAPVSAAELRTRVDRSALRRSRNHGPHLAHPPHYTELTMQYEPSRETQSPPYIPPTDGPYPPQTPTSPAQYSGYPPTSPAAGYPQMYGPPPKSKMAAKDWKQFGLIFGGVLAGFGLLLALVYVTPGVGSSDLDVRITSCELTDGPLPTGTVEYTVTNNGDRRDSARISVEYRNYRGEKVDDDVETSQDVAPGQTVRGAVTTLLDVQVGNGGKCVLMGVS